MDERFHANAATISLLHDQIRDLNVNYERLAQEYRRLQDAQYYMGKLQETIAAHSPLLLEWDNFRELAGLAPMEARLCDDHFIDETRYTKAIWSVDDRETNRLVRAQESLIANLKERAAACQSGIERLTDRIANSTSAYYYLNMQRRIQSDPLVMDAWKIFLMLITLTVDGPIQGITCDDHPRRYC